jgi:hypothetical protein
MEVLKTHQATSTDSIAPWDMHHRKKTWGIRTMYAQCNMVTRSRNHCCHGNATTCSLCIVVDSQVAVSNLNRWALPWRRIGFPLHFCRAVQYFELLSALYTYWGLHLRCPIMLSDFNHIWSLSTDARKIPKYKISLKYVQWESRWYLQTDRRKPGKCPAT